MLLPRSGEDTRPGAARPMGEATAGEARGPARIFDLTMPEDVAMAGAAIAGEEMIVDLRPRAGAPTIVGDAMAAGAGRTADLRPSVGAPMIAGEAMAAGADLTMLDEEIAGAAMAGEERMVDLRPRAGAAIAGAAIAGEERMVDLSPRAGAAIAGAAMAGAERMVDLKPKEGAAIAGAAIAGAARPRGEVSSGDATIAPLLSLASSAITTPATKQRATCFPTELKCRIY